MFRTLISCSVLAATVAWVGADDRRSSQEKGLHGHFGIAYGEKDGKEIPYRELDGSVVHFQGDKILGHDKGRKMFFLARFTLDKSSTPWKIHMTAENPKPGTQADGVIEIVQDSIVNIAYNLPGGEAPSTFKTKEHQQVFTLWRISEVEVVNFRDVK